MWVLVGHFGVDLILCRWSVNEGASEKFPSVLVSTGCRGARWRALDSNQQEPKMHRGLFCGGDGKINTVPGGTWRRRLDTLSDSFLMRNRWRIEGWRSKSLKARGEGEREREREREKREKRESECVSGWVRACILLHVRAVWLNAVWSVVNIWCVCVYFSASRRVLHGRLS